MNPSLDFLRSQLNPIHILTCVTSQDWLEPSPRLNVFQTNTQTYTATPVRPWRLSICMFKVHATIYIYNPVARHWNEIFVISDFRRGLASLVSLLLRADNVGTTLIPVPAKPLKPQVPLAMQASTVSPSCRPHNLASYATLLLLLLLLLMGWD
jgi:hypothetical protein